MDYKNYSKTEIRLIKRLAFIGSRYGIEVSPAMHLDIPMRAEVRRYVYLVLKPLASDLYNIALADANAGLSAEDSTDRVGRSVISGYIRDISALL